MTSTAASSNSTREPPLRPRQSLLYRPELWRAGMMVARHTPPFLAAAMARCAAAAYYWGQRQKREIVMQNLLPILAQDHRAARCLTRRVFQQFALKVVDLCRFESGLPVAPAFVELRNWDIFAQVHARGCGVLLVMPHLGNWELGGSLLTSRGVQLLVITQAEPGTGFTELRQSARARWGIETLVVNEDPFAFVQIIKRLSEGAVVALLLDRPAPATAVAVRLFNRPFMCSRAAAELARATGCALLGGYILRGSIGYVAGFLPEFTYDRKALGLRANRDRLTQDIMLAFEPLIRQHADQWYHFVPIWPAPAAIVPQP